MKSVLFFVIFAFSSIGSTIANYTSQHVGDCYYANDVRVVTFICFDNELKFDFFKVDQTSMQCRNSEVFNKTDVKKIKFLNCQEMLMPIQMFTSFSNVVEIDISGMGLQNWQPEWFFNLKHLIKISAANNRFKAPLVFNGLENIKFLDLSSNPIEEITSETFKSLSNLSHLNLENTNLTTIQPGTFKYQNQLTVVNLSKNKLKEFDLRVFLPSFYSLLIVKLDENRITDLGYSTRPMFPNLRLLSIIWNDLDCNYLQQYLDQGEWDHLRISNDIESTDIYEINRRGRAVCEN